MIDIGNNLFAAIIVISACAAIVGLKFANRPRLAKQTPAVETDTRLRQDSATVIAELQGLRGLLAAEARRNGFQVPGDQEAK